MEIVNENRKEGMGEIKKKHKEKEVGRKKKKLNISPPLAFPKKRPCQSTSSLLLPSVKELA